MRILIAEDDLISRKVLSSFLSQYGECHFAVDGKEAIESFQEAMLRSEGFDLVCMDIMMPNIDGVQAAREIRELESKEGIHPGEGVKIIMISAVENPPSIFEQLSDNDSFCFINKPVRKNRLLELLSEQGLITSS